MKATFTDLLGVIDRLIEIKLDGKEKVKMDKVLLQEVMYASAKAGFDVGVKGEIDPCNIHSLS